MIDGAEVLAATPVVKYPPAPFKATPVSLIEKVGTATSELGGHGDFGVKETVLWSGLKAHADPGCGTEEDKEWPPPASRALCTSSLRPHKDKFCKKE